MMNGNNKTYWKLLTAFVFKELTIPVIYRIAHTEQQARKFQANFLLEKGELLRIEPMLESEVLLMCELANVENITRAFLLNSVKKKEVQSVIKNFSIAFPMFSNFQQKTIHDLDVARFILQGDK